MSRKSLVSLIFSLLLAVATAFFIAPTTTVSSYDHEVDPNDPFVAAGYTQV